MTRRDLLTALAALPLCGWMKPKESVKYVWHDVFMRQVTSYQSRDGGKTWERAGDSLSFGKLSQPTPEMVDDVVLKATGEEV